MNDSTQEIWAEGLRIATRLGSRIRLSLIRRQLVKAERRLGELGWQQAHYDPRDTQFIALQSVEQEQAHLHFEVAEFREKITLQKTVAAEKFAALTTGLVTAENEATEAETSAQRDLACLDAERRREGPAYLIESLERALAASETQLRAARSEAHRHQEILALHEVDSGQKLAALEKSIAVLEAQLAGLEPRKSDHFARIGHNLADVGIAPMNQPGVLTRVLDLRQRAESNATALAESLNTSRALPRAIRLGAFALDLTILLSGVGFLYLLASAIAQA